MGKIYSLGTAVLLTKHIFTHRNQRKGNCRSHTGKSPLFGEHPETALGGRWGQQSCPLLVWKRLSSKVAHYCYGQLVPVLLATGVHNNFILFWGKLSLISVFWIKIDNEGSLVSCSLIPFVLELLNLKMIQNPNNANSFTFTQTMDRK